MKVEYRRQKEKGVLWLRADLIIGLISFEVQYSRTFLWRYISSWEISNVSVYHFFSTRIVFATQTELATPIFNYYISDF